MVRSTAKGNAVKTSPTLTSQKWMNQPLSAVGKNAELVGSLCSSTCFILPMCMKPVKKMTVRGVP
jgi:hypothetical protein